MVAFQNVLILNLMVILLSPTLSYPVYGTKRYGRSASQHVSSWSPYQMMQPQRYPVSYYELYPYGQTYADDYYPQESYPLYYPPARTSKYEVYQAVLPYYYYNDQMLTRPNYGYYDNDPTVDLQEEMIQEAEREEREDAQPIGHELLYENEDQTDENLDDVNAAFLQNLIMSQMYKESLDNHKNYYDDYYTGEDYDKWQDNPKQKSHYVQEDKDVRELKQLVKAKSNPKMDDIHWFKHNNFRNQKDNQYENNYENKRNSYRKKLVKLTTTTSTPDKNTFAPKRDIRGQKEEVLMRPATPVRHPFSNSVMEMMSKDDDRKRSSSVYDTIKHMLDMEKSLENVSLHCFFF